MTNIGEDQEPVIVSSPGDLDELLGILCRGEIWDSAPMHLGKLDWCSLPTFGGAEPPKMLGVWSWDETSMIVGDCRGDLQIVDRSEWFNR